MPKILTKLYSTKLPNLNYALDLPIVISDLPTIVPDLPNVVPYLPTIVSDLPNVVLDLELNMFWVQYVLFQHVSQYVFIQCFLLTS